MDKVNTWSIGFHIFHSWFGVFLLLHENILRHHTTDALHLSNDNYLCLYDGRSFLKHPVFWAGRLQFFTSIPVAPLYVFSSVSPCRLTTPMELCEAYTSSTLVVAVQPAQPLLKWSLEEGANGQEVETKGGDARGGHAVPISRLRSFLPAARFMLSSPLCLSSPKLYFLLLKYTNRAFFQRQYPASPHLYLFFLFFFTLFLSLISGNNLENPINQM